MHDEVFNHSTSEYVMCAYGIYQIITQVENLDEGNAFEKTKKWNQIYMKIQELRFKNLNSLYGEWHIDFNNPEYTSNGIFALTGPTGAGKSTILDAICLALYGKTPRLQAITKSSNELMSRQTGECHAEIIFTSQAGTFLCRWEQRRAKKKAFGALQAPEYQISDALTGKILETSRTGVLKLVEEKTGMDYDRFTRSILLAQGSFDVFLKAKIEEKSSILEQITGTAIYSEISRLVHERQRAEKERFQLLIAENSHLVLLTPEQEKEIQNILVAQSSEEKKLNTEKTSIQNDIVWHKNIISLVAELQKIATEKEFFAIEIKAFSSQKERLKMAIKACEVDSHYAELKALREQQNKDNILIKNKIELIPSLESTFKKSDELEKESIQTLSSTKSESQKNAPIFQKTRLLDQNLNMQSTNLVNQNKLSDEEQTKINTNTKLILEEKNKEKICQEHLKNLQEWFENNIKDKWLIGGLGSVIEQFKTLLSIQQEGVLERNLEKETQKILKTHLLQLEKYTLEAKKTKNEVATLNKELTTERKNLDTLLENRLLREYHTQKENLMREKYLIEQIVQLEDYRKQLEDNKVCPLCGSLEHPYTKGNIPERSSIDKRISELEKRIKQAEKYELAIKELEQKEQNLKVQQIHAENLEINTKEKSKDAQLKADDFSKRIEKSISNYRAKEKEILELLSPLGITAIPSSDISHFHTSLQKRLDTWQQKEKEKDTLEKEWQIIIAEIKKYEALLKAHEASHKELQKKYKELEEIYSKNKQERVLLFADKNVDAEEKNLRDKQEKAEKNELIAKEKHEGNKKLLDSEKIIIKTLKQQIEDKQKVIQKTEKDFQEVLEKINFENEEAYHNATISIEERKKLIEQEKKLEDKEKELITTQKDREQRLAKEEAKQHSDINLEVLEIQFLTLSESLKVINESKIKNQLILDNDKQDKEKFQSKKEQIEKQKKELERWEKLHTLIGSADGKKYRNFAQGLTFELMVAHANKQLCKMSDRYLLVHDKNESLTLNVIDNYQGAEIRSTLNLSGGESFITSLALALGLSQMASQKVRVDSLFLDEGFGTLDEDALETALETLSTIQQEGKLIGVISHVPALKERISTQIKITPLSGGKSILSGPGCSRFFDDI